MMSITFYIRVAYNSTQMYYCLRIDHDNTIDMNGRHALIVIILSELYPANVHLMPLVPLNDALAYSKVEAFVTTNGTKRKL